MQLDRLTIETRVRSAWSAIDLGICLARRFWLRSFYLYLSLALPVLALIMFLSSSTDSMWPYVTLWWFKPIFERPILHMMSRELFAEPMRFRRVLGEFWLWIKPAFFWVITWRRLSFYRGMTAPIMLLEQPKGGDYSKRASVLGSKFSSQALWLTVVLFHIENFLLLALFAMLALFFPDLASDFFQNRSIETSTEIFINVVTLILVAAIAPFYVAAGFMLYICRRIELEGWDIEIVFRDWMSNYKEPLPSTTILSDDAQIEAPQS